MTDGLFRSEDCPWRLPDYTMAQGGEQESRHCQRPSAPLLSRQSSSIQPLSGTGTEGYRPCLPMNRARRVRWVLSSMRPLMTSRWSPDHTGGGKPRLVRSSALSSMSRSGPWRPCGGLILEYLNSIGDYLVSHLDRRRIGLMNQRVAIQSL